MNINGKQQVPAPKSTNEKVEKVICNGLTKVFPVWINPTQEELTSKFGYKEAKEPFAYLGTNTDGVTQMRWEIHCRKLGSNIKDTHYVSATKVGKDGKFKFISNKGLVTGSMFASLEEVKQWASNNAWFGTPVREVFEGEEQLYQFFSILIPQSAQKEEGFTMLLSNPPYTEKAVKEANKVFSDAGLYVTKDDVLTEENFGVCVVVGVKVTDKGLFEEVIKPKYGNPYFKFSKLNKNITADIIGQANNLEDKYDKETKTSERQSYLASVFNPNTEEKWSYRQALQVCAIFDTAKYNSKYALQSLTLEYKPYEDNVHIPNVVKVSQPNGNTNSTEDNLPF